MIGKQVAHGMKRGNSHLRSGKGSNYERVYVTNTPTELDIIQAEYLMASVFCGAVLLSNESIALFSRLGKFSA